jgi:hypothetical protein
MKINVYKTEKQLLTDPIGFFIKKAQNIRV